MVSCIGLAALGASVTEAPRGESASRVFGSGASLTHRPEITCCCLESNRAARLAAEPPLTKGAPTEAGVLWKMVR